MTQQCKLFGIVCPYVDGQLMCTGSTRNDVVSSLTLKNDEKKKNNTCTRDKTGVQRVKNVS